MKEQDSIEDGWFYHSHAWSLLHEIIKLIPEECKSILDVGAGTGIAAAIIQAIYPDINVHVADVEDECFVHWTRRNLFGEMIVNDQLSYLSKAIDCVISSHVIEHINHPNYLIAEMYRICKKRLIIVVPDGDIHFYDHKIIFNRKTLKETIFESIDGDFTYTSFPFYHSHINNLIAVIDKHE